MHHESHPPVFARAASVILMMLRDLLAVLIGYWLHGTVAL
jgi:hypothetical protein